jgi:transposase
MNSLRLIKGSLNVIELDNSRFHSGKKLVLPDNIILLFQPPYCPELNPIEPLWQYLKADLRWASFKTLEELQIKLGQLLADLTSGIIAGVTEYPFILYEFTESYDPWPIIPWQIIHQMKNSSYLPSNCYFSF